MAPNGSVLCPCGKAVVVIQKGKGMCSFCRTGYVLDMTAVPKPPPAMKAAAA